MEIISTRRLSFLCLFFSLFQILIPLSHDGFAASPVTIQCAAPRSSSAHIDGSGVRYLHMESSLFLRKILEDELILMGSIF